MEQRLVSNNSIIELINEKRSNSYLCRHIFVCCFFFQKIQLLRTGFSRPWKRDIGNEIYEILYIVTHSSLATCLLLYPALLSGRKFHACALTNPNSGRYQN